LIDKAALGDIEAAGLLAEGYQTGKYECEKNLAKAKKWATYAAKHGDERAKKVLETL
jgi:TPR repeat protein